MTDNELRKLKRSELLELLVEQSREIDRLREELETANRKLKSKRIQIRESGSIAEASLKLTNIFEAAQEAANLYLANVKYQAVQAGEQRRGADGHGQTAEQKRDAGGHGQAAEQERDAGGHGQAAEQERDAGGRAADSGTRETKRVIG